MRSVPPFFAILVYCLCVNPVIAQKKEATRPAWTSTLQCLAPLAREARSGEGPLAFDQAFFDGPFTRPKRPDDPDHFPVTWKSTQGNSETDSHLGAAFSYLLAFDDVRASQHFREVLQGETHQVAALIGLALINSDSPRRYQCFLKEASSPDRSGGTESSNWLSLLVEHSSSGFLQYAPELIEGWVELATATNNPAIAAALLRQATLFRLLGEEVNMAELDGAVGGLIDESIPRFWLVSENKNEISPDLSLTPFLLSQPRLLQLSGIGSPDLVVTSEFRRLEEMDILMPEATLNLGPFLRQQIHQLENGAQLDAAMALAHSLQALPRDTNSPGTRFRRLTREDSPWVVGRTAEASALLKTGDWETLLHLPRGFSPQDRAEYFAWQVVASARNESDPNLWLAALRREPDSDHLVEQAENFLHAVAAPEEKVSYRIPGVPENFHLSPSLASGESRNSTPVEDPPSIATAFDQWHPRPAQNFSLPDWQNQKIDLSTWKGRPLIVIFFLGGGCLHCVEQLTAFGPWNDRFEEAGIDILAVSTDPVEILSETIRNDDNPQDNFPIPIVSDFPQEVFRQWGVVDEFDERAIHATFLINQEGDIIWEEKGNTPYMHPDFLLYEAKRLLRVE